MWITVLFLYKYRQNLSLSVDNVSSLNNGVLSCIVVYCRQQKALLNKFPKTGSGKSGLCLWNTIHSSDIFIQCCNARVGWLTECGRWNMMECSHDCPSSTENGMQCYSQEDISDPTHALVWVSAPPLRQMVHKHFFQLKPGTPPRLS